jgi:uncharacterized lipoprotein YajG
MQHYKKYLTFLLAVNMLLAGCDKGFSDLNINKVDPIALDPQIVMNDAVILTVYPDNFGTLGML